MCTVRVLVNLYGIPTATSPVRRVTGRIAMNSFGHNAL